MRATLAIAACVVAAATAGRAQEVERIALVGSTFVEREQESGYLETRLALDDVAHVRVVRNLGWSGDTVRGESRAGFGTPADGFKQLRQQVLDFKPTTILVCYGSVESFDGPAGLPGFRAGLGALLDMLAESKAKLILASPPPTEDAGPTLPDPAAHNRDLRLYRDAIRLAAAARKAAFLDLTGDSDGRVATRRTDDGLQFHARGYWEISRTIALDGFGVGPAAWKLDLAVTSDEVHQKVEQESAGIDFLSAGAATRGADCTGVAFALRARHLPAPRAPGLPPAGEFPRLTVRKLEPAEARFALRSDGRVLRVETGAAWAGGVRLDAGPDFDQVEQLRRAIVAKNQLFFYRWRPQNETYLFGFRKHEQGNNAREIPMFDPLITAAEAEVERLRVPALHTYEIVREGEAAR